ncbi:hypothetical protein HJC23_008485 [Cyclotella cryptica]|uniref:Uncharacterized protein n=1 Tax=Cyclotella cryptica TaxID=29204 RepID=A0ABD3QWC5_9STRA
MKLTASFATFTLLFTSVHAGTVRFGEFSKHISTDTFTQGFNEGTRIAEEMWANSGSDCANVFTFDRDVDRYINANFRSDGTVNTAVFNLGVEAGGDVATKRQEAACCSSHRRYCD